MKTNNKAKEAPVMEKNKRNRARNFTSDEIRALIRAVTKYSVILEDKTTDSNNWEKKNETWKQIANEFNATNSVFRNEEVLRNKYDNLKKDLKKKVAYNKAQTFRTGGGASDYKTFNEDEKELLKIISLSVNGLPTEPGSDQILPATTITGELINSSSSTIECTEWNIEEPEDPSSTDFVKALDNPIIFEGDFVENEVAEANVLTAKDPKQMIQPNPKIEASQKWQFWCPSKLQSRKHSALNIKKKAITADRTALNRKIEQLIESKIELVMLQKTYTTNEEERRAKKYEAEIQNLRQAAEQQKLEHLKRMEILEIEIQTKKRQWLL
ncbi:hypothetical protein ABEB36_014936 [Hypothenemus hampei]|uniref:Regulatory protein zeste n=1 Tax=Hypothenemus hampei TaxID=57062 RepID=A0ABD1E1K4_HYPHA